MQLGFPNGFCSTPTYTVTNGNTAAQIDVTGADAVPSPGPGANWTLVGSTPGQNQYQETISGGGIGVARTNSPMCNPTFKIPVRPSGGGCYFD